MEVKPIPELTENKPGARLNEFYKKLGWNNEDMLDPRYIKMTEVDLNALIKREMDHVNDIFPEISDGDIAVGVGMLYVNSGPSGYGSTPGMVELHPGWVQEEKRAH